MCPVGEREGWRLRDLSGQRNTNVAQQGYPRALPQFVEGSRPLDSTSSSTAARFRAGAVQVQGLQARPCFQYDAGSVLIQI